MIDILNITIGRFLRSLPILLLAIIVARVLNSYLSRGLVENLRKRRLRETLSVVALAGLVTPGPLACYLPLLRVLRKTGFPLSLIVAFITAQTLVGPMRLFLEVAYFGAWFYAYRVVTSFIIAISIGAIYHLLERRISF